MIKHTINTIALVHIGITLIPQEIIIVRHITPNIIAMVFSIFLMIFPLFF